MILVVKWQRTWQNCAHVLVFYGRQNLQAMTLDILKKKKSDLKSHPRRKLPI